MQSITKHVKCLRHTAPESSGSNPLRFVLFTHPIFRKLVSVSSPFWHETPKTAFLLVLSASGYGQTAKTAINNNDNYWLAVSKSGLVHRFPFPGHPHTNYWNRLNFHYKRPARKFGPLSPNLDLGVCKHSQFLLTEANAKTVFTGADFLPHFDLTVDLKKLQLLNNFSILGKCALVHPLGIPSALPH